MKLTKKQMKLLIRIILCAVLFAVGMVLLKTGVIGEDKNIYICLAVFLVPYILISYDIILIAIRNIKRGDFFDENFLMIIATFGAFAIKEFEETVAVMLLFQIGELLQSYAVGKSRKSIMDMMSIAPEYANLIGEDGEAEQVDPDDVSVGDIILVRSGEKIPLDGIVIEGKSLVDTSALTGESVPRTVEVDDEILSGCINGQGMLKVRVTKEYDDSTVAKVLELVENASDNKAKTENFIHSFAKVYTPIIVILAVLLAVVPTVFGLRSLEASITSACVFLVTSCPCALVISVPLSYFGGIGAAAKQGILIKGGNYLEALAKADTFVFDKTGTLTKGNFTVTSIVKSGDVSDETILSLAAAAEKGSTHPLGQAILKYAKDAGITFAEVISIEEIPGHGVAAKTDKGTCYVGNYRLMQKFNIQANECTEIGSLCYVALDNEYLGVIVVADEIKTDSKSAIAELKAAGIKKAIMLSGDKKAVADAIGSTVGLDMILSELLPDQKVNELKKILDANKNGNVAYVGDGINDAPALASADVGIAMGSLGSDAAIEAADIVLMDDHMSKLPKALKISRKTSFIVKENIVGSLLVKFVVLCLGALGFATMWAAIIADVGVMLAAVINATRCQRIK